MRQGFDVLIDVARKGVRGERTEVRLRFRSEVVNKGGKAKYV